MVKRQLTIGGVDAASFLADELALPVLDDIPVVAWVRDSLDQAVVQRKGVAVVGEKGVGKSFALEEIALPDFVKTEDAARDADNMRPRRRVKVIQAPRGKKPEELIAYIWKSVSKEEMVLTHRGKSKGQDTLMQELVEELLGVGVAALVIDECENINSVGLDVLRDIVSIGERRSKEGKADGRHRARGVGLLLLGTLEFGGALARHEEAGRRWLAIHHVEPLTSDEAATVYARFLPGFAKQAKRLGSDGWRTFIHQRVALGRPVPISRIDAHVRNYVRRIVLDDPTISNVESIPFDEELFFATLSELATRQDDTE